MEGAGPDDGRYQLRGRQFVVIYDFMGRDLGLSNSDLVVYARIFGFAKTGRPFYESKKGTADFYGISRRSVFDSIKRLKERGLIEETDPCEEAVKVGTKCYLPSAAPLRSIGVLDDGEDSSPPGRPSDADSSPPDPSSDEDSSPPPMKEVHPIAKVNNKHFR